VEIEADCVIACPYCGQPINLVVDTTAGPQTFTTDCEICCRPVEILAECEPGRVIQLSANVE
jgi:hypothetical protein